MRDDRGERLTWAQLAIFSLPVVLFQAIELPWRIFVPSFFAETLGLPLATVGTLLMAIRLFDTVADPPIGWASDRFPTRFGQRRPWLVIGAPLVMLGTWQVFFAAPGTGVALLGAWCVVMHLGYCLMLTPHGGWGLEISRDYHERTRIMGAKVWFAAAGMPFTLLLPSILERSFGASRAEQIGAMGLLLIILAPLSAFLVVRFIPEPAIDRAAARRTIDPFRQFAAIVKNRELAVILALYALIGIADASSSATFLFFVEQVLGLTGWMATLMLIPAFVGLGTLPLWAMVSRRFGKRRALMGIFAWQAVTAPLALLLPQDGLVPAMVYLLIRNVSFGGDYMLLRSMVADVSGRDAAGGLRRSGSYYALFNVTLKLAAGLGVGLALWVLAGAGFVPGTAADGVALGTIRLVYVLPTCLAGLAGLLVLAGSAREDGPEVAAGLTAGSKG